MWNIFAYKWPHILKQYLHSFKNIHFTHKNNMSYFVKVKKA